MLRYATHHERASVGIGNVEGVSFFGKAKERPKRNHESIIEKYTTRRVGSITVYLRN